MDKPTDCAAVARLIGPLEPASPGSIGIGGSTYYSILGRLYESSIRNGHSIHPAADIAFAVHTAIEDGAQHRAWERELVASRKVAS